MRNISLHIITILLLGAQSLFAQQTIEETLTLEEYLGYVKNYHPIVKQAGLVVNESEAKLLKSRGAFDPKLELDYSNKEFEGTEYYDKLNAAFKVPTWYGVEFKGNYEQNSGTYLNPEATVPEDGLYSVGVSVSLAKGLLANERMTQLKQAKLYNQQALVDQKLMVNDILYNSLLTYFNWLQAYQSLKVYEDFVVNANQRLENVKSNFNAGDKPAIDTLEASINLKNRMLELEQAKILYIKSKLEASNYLWVGDNIPLELKDEMNPDDNTFYIIDEVLNTSVLNTENVNLEEHPKIQSLSFKRQGLEYEQRLQKSNLLPKIDFQYNFLTNNEFNSLNTSDYKAGLNVSIPIFMRKERSDYKLSKIKLQDLDYDIEATKIVLSNKINSIIQEIESYDAQNQITMQLVSDNEQLVRAEERKFDLGEGLLFLINYREAVLIKTKVKAIKTQYSYLKSKASLANILVSM